jgi:MoaA/NifB/PqqE/SkfB family radical SAM enzyme
MSVGTRVSIRARPQPRVLLLPMTMRCNAKCAMCTIWQAEPVGFTQDLLAKAFDGGVLGGKLEYLGLTGGEPTTLKRFDDLALYALDQCPNLREVSYNTNGFATVPAVRTVERLLAVTEPRGIRLRLYVSLDGVGEVHDTVRGIPGVFAKTVRTIQSLKELSENRGCDLSINSVVTRQNADSVNTTLRYAHEIDVPINFSLVMNTDVCINSADSEVEFEILPEQIPDLRKSLSRIRMLTRLKGAGSVEEQYYDHLLGMLDGIPRKLACPFAESAGCLIDPWGDVYPCGVSKELHMGNLNDRTFADIWYDESTWRRLDADMPGFCAQCESNCFVHAADDLGLQVGATR